MPDRAKKRRPVERDIATPTNALRRLPIERRAGLSQQVFAAEYGHNTGKPVIVTDALDKWPARTKWTFEFLKVAYGNDTVLPVAGPRGKAVRVTKLADYIDYLDEPSKRLRGFWIDPSTRLPVAGPSEKSGGPLYLLGWRAFQAHPELYKDIEPVPHFIDDWVGALTPSLRDAFEWTSKREYWSLYVGPGETLSELHVDFWRTHSYLAQIQGRKRCILFSPDDTSRLYDGQVNPEMPDFERFELLRGATAYDAILAPGEVLFTPPGWWHHVRALDKSITVSHNFFNQTNFAEHIAGIIRNLPSLVSGLDESPNARTDLRIRWRCRGFDERP
jgi:hypothetical protein